MTARTLALALSALAIPALTGATGCWSQSAAPDLTGTWTVTYEDDLDVVITLGGATYTSELGAQGGTVTIDHEGQPISFDIDCADEDVVCPSEAWPGEIDAEHRDARYPSRFTALLPSQECDGELVEPAPEECGEGTANPDCEAICEGEIVPTTEDRFGWVDEDGGHMNLLLGAGFASNGVNCALLGVSAADADLVTLGGPNGKTWTAESMENGAVTTAYSGGCLWAGDGDEDGEVEALVLGASVSFSTSFTAVRAPLAEEPEEESAAE